jgi:hypothetical protein
VLNRIGARALWVSLMLVPLACCSDGVRHPESERTLATTESATDPITLLVGEAPGDVLVLAGPYETSSSRQAMLKAELAHRTGRDPASFEPWSLQVYNFGSSPAEEWVLPAAGGRLTVRAGGREFHELVTSLTSKEKSNDPMLAALAGGTQALAVPDGKSVEVLVLMEHGLKVEDCQDATVPSPTGAVTLKPRQLFRVQYEDFLSQPRPHGLAEMQALSAGRSTPTPEPVVK